MAAVGDSTLEQWCVLQRLIGIAPGVTQSFQNLFCVLLPQRDPFK